MLQAELRDVALQLEDAWQAPSEAAQRKDDRPALLGTLSTNASLVAWLVFLGFGGSLLTLYYTQIHYFPELEWKNSLTYLAAMSVLGGGVVAIYGLLLYFPGVIWSEFLIFDRDLCREFCSASPDDLPTVLNEPCFWHTWTSLGFPFSVFMVVVHVGMLGKIPGFISATIGGLIALTWYSLDYFPKVLRRLRVDAAKQRSLRAKYITAIGVAALSSLASLLFLEWLIRASATWQLAVICTATVVISNFLVAVQFRNKPGRAAVVGILAALVLLCCGEYLDGGKEALSTRIMRGFGLGGEPAVTLIVAGEGVEVLEAYKLPPSVFSTIGTARAPNGSALPLPNVSREGALRGAKILSRLGSEYLIEVQGQRITLPKGMVRSWSAQVAPARPAAAATQRAVEVQ